MKTIRNLLTSLLSVATINCFAVGTDIGNGGDGVIRDGELIIRDFLNESQPVLVENNEAFLDSIPGFRDLIRKIGAAHPHLAFGLEDDLARVRIWIADGSLPVLPTEITTYYGSKAEVQIAIRDGDDIILGPEFERSPKEYIILHESLHAMIPGKGPIHHQMVRSLVRHIKENYDQLDSERLTDLTKRFGIQNVDSIDADESVIRVTRAYFDESLPMIDRCVRMYYVSDELRGRGRAINRFNNFIKSNCEKYIQYDSADGNYIMISTQSWFNIVLFKVLGPQQYDRLIDLHGIFDHQLTSRPQKKSQLLKIADDLNRATKWHYFNNTYESENARKYLDLEQKGEKDPYLYKLGTYDRFVEQRERLETKRKFCSNIGVNLEKNVKDVLKQYEELRKMIFAIVYSNELMNSLNAETKLLLENSLLANSGPIYTTYLLFFTDKVEELLRINKKYSERCTQLGYKIDRVSKIISP